MEVASQKLGGKVAEYTSANAVVVLAELVQRDDVDAVLLAKTHETIALPAP
jgi:hypothetical protein